MTGKASKRSGDSFEAALEARRQERYVLRLYIAGTSKRSMIAVKDIRRICEEHLNGRYSLEVIDIYQQPTLARDHQIEAVPTLLRVLPKPLKVSIGTIADKERLLVGLDLISTKTSSGA